MIERYSTKEIRDCFSEASKFNSWLVVEREILRGWVKAGTAPEGALAAMSQVIIDPARVAQLEKEQRHDVAAFVTHVQEQMGAYGRFVHLGVTSSDVLDTASSLVMRRATECIAAACAVLAESLASVARREAFTWCIGRTHGVHADVVTIGLRFAIVRDELLHACSRLESARDEVCVAKVRGAVGTYATLPETIEETVASHLGLPRVSSATQVVSRDRYASYVCAIGILGSVMERIALVIRLSQQTELGELMEPFGIHQKGSSAMPHKRNPVRSERIAGLARVLRGYAATALEDIPLWFERDISHSSAERVILPDACALVTFMAKDLGEVIEHMTIDTSHITRNLGLGYGTEYSQRVLFALIAEAHWSREEAYARVQALSFKAVSQERNFAQCVQEDEEIRSALGTKGIDSCFQAPLDPAMVEKLLRDLGIEGDLRHEA